MPSTARENSRPNFTFHPLLWIATCFATGISVASKTNLDWKTGLGIALVFAVLAGIFLKKTVAKHLLFIAFFFGGAFYYNVIKLIEPENSIRRLIDTGQVKSGDPMEIEGIIASKPEPSVGGFYLRLSVERIIYLGEERFASGEIRFFAPIRDEQTQREYDELKLASIARIRVASNLEREQRYLNPGGSSFAEILDQKGLDATGLIKSPLLIERLEDIQTPSLISWVYDYRLDLIRKIKSKFDVSTSGILIASLLGNRSHLTKDNAEIFREGGTFHLLVISGLHITFIGGLLLVFIGWFTRNRVLQILVVSSVLWVYVLAVGAEIPVVRAALMMTILLFSFVLYRESNLLNTLGACALVILLWRPNDLFSQSFHLTFVSLFGIIAVAFPLIEKLREIGMWTPSPENPFPPRVHPKLKVFCETLFWSETAWRKTLGENVWECKLFKSPNAAALEKWGLQRPLRWIFEGVLVTTVVQIFLIPFLVIYFHRVSFGSILLNLWVGLFLVLQNVAALTGLLFGLASETLSLPLVKLAEFFNWVMLAIPNLFIDYDLASFRVPIYSGKMRAIYALYFVPLIILIFKLNRWNPFENPIVSDKKTPRSRIFLRKNFTLLTFIIYLVLLSGVVLHPSSSPTLDGKLKVDFLDVGQGDSALITFPNGETMLVDGGGKHNFSKLFVEGSDGEPEPFEPDTRGVGNTVVSEFLWEKGYSRVDYILATHADADHIQGLTAVAGNFDVKLAMMGVDTSSDENFVEFTDTLRKENIPRRNLSSGDEFEIGGARITILSPEVNNQAAEGSSNNSSLVFSLSYRNRTFLFTGDIEAETEQKLTDKPGLLRADIVKVAHHGSRTSSTRDFINATGAQYAIIPVGRKSPFGHPHGEVLKRWKNSGAKILMTGERGTISVSTNGSNIEIQRFIE